MIELMVTMAIAGLLLVLAALGWREYSVTQAQRGTADGLVVLMRDAHQRAVTEGTAYAVKLTPADGPWVLSKSVDCSATALGGEVAGRGGVTVAGSPSCVVFKPRGTATAGTVDVHRAGSSKVYTITVEGLTGRASLS
jgi:Tfp pilus assembly protein FimT